MKAASQFDVDTEPFDSESDSESDCKGYRQRRRDSFIFYSRQYDGRYRYYSGGFLIAIAVVVNLIFTIFTLAFSIKSKFKLYIHV